jgi:hypothetical protein
MKNNLSNITLLLSTAIFLFASAFTNDTSTIEMDYTGSCYTCSLGSSGSPTGCKNASFCGMTFCDSFGGCELSGELCGECACEDPTVPCEG